MQRIRALSILLSIAVLGACGGKQAQPTGQAGGAADSPGAAGVTDSTMAGAGEGAAAAGAGKKSWVIPATSQPAPDALIAAVVLGNPQACLASLGNAIRQIEPKAAMMLHPGVLDELMAKLSGAPRLAGIDYSKPVRILVMDPFTVNPPVLLVVSVADEGALRDAVGQEGPGVFAHGGFAVIGSGAAMDAGTVYALSTAVKEQAPSQPTVTIYARKIVQQHGPQIDALVQMAKASLAQSGAQGDVESVIKFVEGMVELIKQVDRLVFSLDIGVAELTGHVRALPIAQSEFAAFLGKQKPATFAQLATLQPGTVVFAGRLDWKELFGGMIAAMSSSSAKALGIDAKSLVELQKKWAEHMREEFAMTGGYRPKSGMWLATSMEIADAPALNKLMNQWFKMMPKKAGDKGVEMTIKHRRNALRHRGVGVSEMKLAFAKGVPPQAKEVMDKVFGKGGMRMMFAAFGKTSAMAMGSDARARIKTIIDVSKGKKKAFEPSAELASALKKAQERKESMIFALDLPGLVAAIKGPATPVASGGEPMVLAVGFADGAAGLRVTLPISQVKAVMPMAAP